jgi:hypothetical protein
MVIRARQIAIGLLPEEPERWMVANRQECVVRDTPLTRTTA